MFIASAAIVARKLPVDDQITACVRDKYVCLVLHVKFRIEKH